MKVPRRQSPRAMLQRQERHPRADSIIGRERIRIATALQGLPREMSWPHCREVLMRIRPHKPKIPTTPEEYAERYGLRSERRAFWRAGRQVWRERQRWQAWEDVRLLPAEEMPLFHQENTG